MNRIVERFNLLKKSGGKAFIPFITAGFPDFERCLELVLEFERRGADIIEIGIPFSDPLADGPVIQTASFEALKGGMNTERVFDFVRKVREKSKVPLVFMEYYNPIFKFGEKRFLEEAHRVGVDGIIVPDLPPEESGGVVKQAKKMDLATIFLLTPVSSDLRIHLVANLSRGFIYCVSYTGVTGKKGREQEFLEPVIGKVRKFCSTPVAVGFGVSSLSDARKMAAFADAVIVGSAIIKKIMENINRENMVEKVGSFVYSLCKSIKDENNPLL